MRKVLASQESRLSEAVGRCAVESGAGRDSVLPNGGSGPVQRLL